MPYITPRTLDHLKSQRGLTQGLYLGMDASDGAPGLSQPNRREVLALAGAGALGIGSLTWNDNLAEDALLEPIKTDIEAASPVQNQKALSRILGLIADCGDDKSFMVKLAAMSSDLNLSPFLRKDETRAGAIDPRLTDASLRSLIMNGDFAATARTIQAIGANDSTESMAMKAQVMYALKSIIAPV